MAKKIKVLVPAYYKKFRCIGGDCEDTCCKNWMIYIDKASYKRFKEEKHLPLNPVLDKNIEVNNQRKSAQSYGILKLCSNELLSVKEIDSAEHKYCPYLSEAKLCRLYLELGEDYMPDVCKSYPRLVNKIDGEYELSLNLSCPEAARVALESPELMEFEHIELDYDSWMERSAPVFNTQNNYVLREFWNIRIASIRLLQNRRFDIPTRLTLLGMLYQRIQKVIDEKKPGEIVETVTDFLESVDLADSDILGGLEKDRMAQLLALKFMVSERVLPRRMKSRFRDILDNAVGLLANSENEDPSQPIEDISISYETLLRFEQLNQEKLLPFIRSEEIMAVFEHYLVNTCFLKFLPFSLGLEIFEGVRYLAAQYYMIKILLAGQFFANRKISKEGLLDLIYLYGKHLPQSIWYKDFIESSVGYINLDTLGGLYTLLFD